MSDETARSAVVEDSREVSRVRAARRAPQTARSRGSEAELRRCVAAVEHEATELGARLRALDRHRDAAAFWRLIASAALLAAIGLAAYLYVPPLALALGLPLVVGGLIALMRLDHAARWLRRLFAASSHLAVQPAGPSRWRRFVARPVLQGLAAIGEWTGSVRNRYVRAGLGGAATLYYGGGVAAAGASVVGIALFAAYIALSIMVALIVIGLVVAVLLAVFGSK